MKKIVQILLLCLIAITSFGQEKKDSLIKENRWSAYIGGSVNYLFPDFYTKPLASSAWCSNIAAPVYKIGVDMLQSYYLSKSGSINFGLCFNQLETMSTFRCWQASTGIIENRTCAYSFIGIPFFYESDFGTKRKIGLSVNFGLLFNILFSNKRERVNNFGNNFSESNMTNGALSIFGTGGSQINIRLSAKNTLKIGLQFGQQVTPINLHTISSYRMPFDKKVFLHYLRLQVGIKLRVNDVFWKYKFEPLK